METSDAPPSSPNPFPVALDLLERNLEEKRQAGFACPHCNQIMGPFSETTKSEIIAVLKKGESHEKPLFCDNNDCPSVEKDTDGSLIVNPFIRQISIDEKGEIIMRTFTLPDFLETSRKAERQAIETLRAVYHTRLAAIQSDKAVVDAKLANRTRQLGEIEDQLRLARDMITVTTEQRAALQRILNDIDRIAGVQARENSLGVISELARLAGQLKEACSLGGITPEQLIANAKAWAAKQEPKRRKK